jgi:hypothetical protein
VVTLKYLSTLNPWLAASCGLSVAETQIITHSNCRGLLCDRRGESCLDARPTMECGCLNDVGRCRGNAGALVGLDDTRFVGISVTGAIDDKP